MLKFLKYHRLNRVFTDATLSPPGQGVALAGAAASGLVMTRGRPSPAPERRGWSWPRGVVAASSLCGSVRRTELCRSEPWRNFWKVLHSLCKMRFFFLESHSTLGLRTPEKREPPPGTRVRWSLLPRRGGAGTRNGHVSDEGPCSAGFAAGPTWRGGPLHPPGL